MKNTLKEIYQLYKNFFFANESVGRNIENSSLSAIRDDADDKAFDKKEMLYDFLRNNHQGIMAEMMYYVLPKSLTSKIKYPNVDDAYLKTIFVYEDEAADGYSHSIGLEWWYLETELFGEDFCNWGNFDDLPKPDKDKIYDFFLGKLKLR